MLPYKCHLIPAYKCPRERINAGDTVYSQLLLAGVYEVLWDHNTHCHFLYIPATVNQDLISCLNLPNKVNTLASLTHPDSFTFLDRGPHFKNINMHSRQYKARKKMMLLCEQLSNFFLPSFIYLFIYLFIYFTILSFCQAILVYSQI